MRVLSIVSLVALLLVSAFAGDVVILTPDNFDSVVNGEKNVLVEFFAPWCGHCKSLAPEYEVAATAFKGVKDIVIASVDADAHKELGSRFGVTGFPTLKYFAKGGKVEAPKDYGGGRTAGDIVQWINSEAGVRGVIKKAPSSVVVLTTSNFDKVVDGSKNVLVEFYAPWCGHCKTLAPKYEVLGNYFAAEADVVIAKVDADAASGRPLGEKFGVKGFPTIKFFPKGSTEPVDYEGAREVSDFVTFLNGKAGTKRTATGGLEESAGRVAALDAIVESLVSGAKKSVASELAAASKSLTGAAKEAAAFYAVVAKKYETEGAAFVTAQVARIRGLLEGASLVAAKKDEFHVKLNILAAFAKK